MGTHGPSAGADDHGGGPADDGAGESVSPEAKRAAFERVLHSATFERADQLRRFLRYVCEMDLAGRAQELNEHLIGVEALGRPAQYSTTEDSSVRRCAHALRQKLEEAYATELAQAPVRIELRRGGYQPHFRWVGQTTEPVTLAPPSPLEGHRTRRAFGITWIFAAFAAGALLTTAALRPRSTSRVDPILVEAWGPLSRSASNPVICVSAPPHYGILPYPDGPLPPGVTPLAGPLDLTPWWRQHYPLPPGYRLASHLTTGPIRLGEVLGLVTAIRTFDRMGVEPEVVAEKYAMLPTLRGRNLLLFGNPEYSHATAELLERAPLTVAYDVSYRDRIVRSHRVTETKVFTPTRNERGTLTDVLGLITVLPSEGASGAAGGQRTVIVSCTNAGGCEAAMEFFASAASLRSLLDRLRTEGFSSFPPAYQVVIRSKVFQSAQAISGDYEAHVVFQRQQAVPRAVKAPAP